MVGSLAVGNFLKYYTFRAPKVFGQNNLYAAWSIHGKFSAKIVTEESGEQDLEGLQVKATY